MTFRPVLMTWNASERTMTLVPRFARVADAQFTDGEEYPLEVVEDRSSAEHNQYFASIGDAWDHITDPETIALLGGPDGLRDWALIQTGWCYTTVIGPLSKRAAIKSAQGAAVNFRRLFDERGAKRRGNYIEIVIRKSHDEETGDENGWAVVIKTPMSQSRAAMKKEPFRESKQAVLDVLSGHIEVKRRDLEKAGRDSA